METYNRNIRSLNKWKTLHPKNVFTGKMGLGSTSRRFLQAIYEVILLNRRSFSLFANIFEISLQIFTIKSWSFFGVFLKEL
jgi:hypothetical protein